LDQQALAPALALGSVMGLDSATDWVTMFRSERFWYS